MSKELTVVVPAYNEQDSIEKTVRQISEAVPEAKILVVDDCSKDNTLKILLDLKKQKQFKNLNIIHHHKNGNYGTALKTGFYNTKTKYVAFLDADGTYPPKYLPVFLKILQKRNLDAIYGNRFGGKCGMPIVRQFGNKLLTLVFFVFTGRILPDICSGERLFVTQKLLKLDPKTLPKKLDFITGLTKRMVTRKLKFTTYPIDYPRREGQSKLNIYADFIRMSWNIVKYQ